VFRFVWFGRRLFGVVLLLELDRAEEAEPFLDAAEVIQAVDVLEEREFASALVVKVLPRRPSVLMSIQSSPRRR
jgi:hypothetical protein